MASEQLESIEVKPACLRFKPISPRIQVILGTRISSMGEEHSNQDLGAPCSSLPTEADGNCFYRAVSLCVTGTEEFHASLRRTVVDWMTKNPGAYKGCLRRKYNSTLDYIKQEKPEVLDTWATEVEIQATADHLGVDIYTHLNGSWVRYASSSDSDQGIYLSNNNCHYTVVTCVKTRDGMCHRRCEEESQPDIIFNNVEVQQKGEEMEYMKTDSDSPQVGSDDIVRDTYESQDSEEDESQDSEEDERQDSEEDERQDSEDDESQDSEEDERQDSEEDESQVSEEDESQNIWRTIFRSRDFYNSLPNNSKLRERVCDWSVLNATWETFINSPMSIRFWWGAASKRDIRAALLSCPEEKAMTISSAIQDKRSGSVFRVGSKDSGQVSVHCVYLRAGRYICPELSDERCLFPETLIFQLGKELGKDVCLLPRPQGFSGQDRAFSVEHITREIQHTVDNPLGNAFWGVFHLEEYKSLRLALKARERPSDKYLPCAGVYFEDEIELGYVMDLVTPLKERLCIGFNHKGFYCDSTFYMDYEKLWDLISEVLRHYGLTLAR